MYNKPMLKKKMIQFFYKNYEDFIYEFVFL
jgi:hypothetical protein